MKTEQNRDKINKIKFTEKELLTEKPIQMKKIELFIK